MKSKPLTILSAHNFYQEAGGEDRVFAAEADLLEANGHTVERYLDHNTRITRASLSTATNTVWSIDSYKKVRASAVASSADLAHFHNTFPLISPAAYYAVQRAGIPVVQTLHNFRLICPGATFSRNGSVCESCVEQNSLLPAIRNRCYRGSLTATTALTAMLTIHRAAGTYDTQVDAYIALSEFARNKFIVSGLPADRIYVKPNFVADPISRVRKGAGHTQTTNRDRQEAGRPNPAPYALFAGRLSKEKGVATLASAWTCLPNIPLKVAGDGSLSTTAWSRNVTTLGNQPHDRVLSLMRDATMLIVPSTCYENCPMAILEAFACGLPVIASNLGSMAERVRHGHNGLLFRPGDPADLAEKVRWAFDHPQELQAMRENARLEFTEKYTPERNYKLLIAIYEQAIENKQRRSRDRKVS